MTTCIKTNRFFVVNGGFTETFADLTVALTRAELVADRENQISWIFDLDPPAAVRKVYPAPIPSRPQTIIYTMGGL